MRGIEDRCAIGTRDRIAVAIREIDIVLAILVGVAKAVDLASALLEEIFHFIILVILCRRQGDGFWVDAGRKGQRREENQIAHRNGFLLSVKLDGRPLHVNTAGRF